ncbi:Peroxiredoxin [Owenweeksia hongkongensis DSM 17368]|uniref:thioredoxin-dependent peroxiredoxin n=1 Tax=Owenweeksia hongkongensis (strain DSM 17368 / CIP 108786 / JCM 12287 / NRRL B-23963 / UST20020801) TaxID=926562 RepID=G8R821_OWEHD|nr:peroxiredoxin family protein [Owenweeksia hongkongensis]AEV31344.1 Peroxiredoxin [Owenweeksia hongkongensis DSM 17368]
MNSTKKVFALLAFTFLFSASSLLAQNDYKTVDEVEGLAVGTKVKNFKAVDQNGKTFDLNKSLKKGPVVVVFYRGQWCPICNRNLSNLQDSLQLISDAGATMVAISPEKPEDLKVTAEKSGAKFELLHDEGEKISTDFDVLYMPSKPDAKPIPVPATYVIDTDGTIIWRHFDRNYKNRATSKQILEALK